MRVNDDQRKALFAFGLSSPSPAFMLADVPDNSGLDCMEILVMLEVSKKPLKLGLSGGLFGGFLAIVK